MAEIGGLLAAAVLKGAAGKVAAAAGDRIMLQWRYRKDLEYMKDTLESIGAVLEDAEKRSIEDAEVRLWLQRLTTASYNISDMFDEFEVKTAKKSALRKLKVLNPCLTLVSEVGLAGKMKEAREKLEHISNLHQKFCFVAGSSSYVQPVRDERLTSPMVFEADILGRDEEKEKLIDLLMNTRTSSDFIVLPIHGIGGIGKTTLAQLIYNDTCFKNYKKAWVYVSETFDLKKINDTITSELEVQSQLTDTLEPNDACKKILIVLDDLWENNDFKLDGLKSSLKMVGNGCRMHVIVTTREAGIAQKIQTTEAHKIVPLSSDLCWAIIRQQIVDFEDRADKERLEDTGKKIAEKCGGVALAARALGFMLRFKNYSEWVSVKDSGLWNLAGNKHSAYDHVLASLKLSFSNLLPYQRLCFAYCAIFPKGQKMEKVDLIFQWAAHGFIKLSDNISTWQDGENCINELLGMSFFQHSKSPSSNGQHDEAITVLTMHDLVYDLARLILGDEVLDASTRECNIGRRNYRYASLADSSKPLNSFVAYPDKIRALRFLGSCKIGECDAGLSTAKYLRVLDLGECSIQKLPSSVGQLKLLRYLNAPGIKDRMIPSCVTKLSKLIYLNLRGSSMLSALPDSIGEMESLMYLDISGCSEIRHLPESFRKLRKLVHLDFSNCSRVRGVSEFLNNLTQLQYLNLSCSSYSEVMSDGDVLGTLTSLEYLNLSSRSNTSLKRLPESLGSFTELKYLNLSGCELLEELPGTFGNLRNLVHLDLSYCSNVNGLLEALRSLTELRYLNLSGTSKCVSILGEPLLRGLGEMIRELTELRYLNLSYYLSRVPSLSWYFDYLWWSISMLSDLEHLDLSYNNIWKIPDSILSLRKLHTLDLTGCTYLRWLPENIGCMDSLNFLFVSGCTNLVKKPTLRVGKSSISLPKFVVEAAEGEQSSNLVLLKDENPIVLEIRRLENVKTREEAQRIKLGEKQMMVKLALHWTSGKKGSVEDMELLSELGPPKSLDEFELRGYSSVSFPAWLMGIANYLPNLTRVKLAGLPQCSRLPPLGQLPNLKSLYLEAIPSITKIDRDFWGGVHAFAKLENLSISNMESLEEWSTSYSHAEGGADKFMFPNLCYLTIQGCRKLRVNPCPPRVKGAWDIIDSDGVLLHWGDSAPSTASSTSSAPVRLMVRSCTAPMHKWKLLHHLPALNNLIIADCTEDFNDPSSSLEIDGVTFSIQHLDLVSSTSLPQCLGNLSSLRILKIEDCPNLNNLPESIGKLSSLKSVYLIGCKGIEALPESLGDLSSLYELRIMDCPKLNNLPESVQHLSSLQVLHLSECTGIQALPEGLGDLCSLDSVTINDCPNLNNLPQSMGNLSSLMSLHLIGCEGIEALPEQLGDLTSLLYLHITRLPRLNNLPESMRHLSSLESLCLVDCGGIQALPEQLGDLTSLRYLQITQLPRLNNLPESMRNLSSLQSLRLADCGGIQALPELLGDLLSLKGMWISRCAGIVSLPESIQQLTNLEELDIQDCPALQQWCNLEENKWKIAHIKRVSIR
ncbi:hypothetical protein ACP70R_030117 [Stipagrostis hirtigluma subsp. patula]